MDAPSPHDPTIPDAPEDAQRSTLRPPEWSAATDKHERRLSSAPTPLSRREGQSATEGTMRARLAAARALRDPGAEREAAVTFARWLAKAGHGLDEAAAIARQVLEQDAGADGPAVVTGRKGAPDGSELRLELASWLETLGEPAAAADVLGPLTTGPDADPAEAARVLVRIGVLHARAGDAAKANESLRKAASLHPGDAVAAELRGTLAVWAPGVLPLADAAEAYVDAAARRAAAGAIDAQLEDLLRAFDTDPRSGVAVAALAVALVERGKPGAADEVWRAHAGALRTRDPDRAAAVHARRRLQARATGDSVRALGAALDDGLDARFEGEAADAMDELLLRVGLLEPLAARLELRAEREVGAARARMLEELARLLAGPLASPERAATARVSAIEADPACAEAMVALRAHASATRDATQLVEALVRAVATREAQAGEGKGGEGASAVRLARVSCARTLAALAEDQLGDPALAMWAYQALRQLEAREPSWALAGIDRHASKCAALRERLAVASRELEASKDDARVEPLRALAALLRSMPDEAERHSQVLAELSVRAPSERKWRIEALRVAWRRHDHVEVARLAEEQLRGGTAALSMSDAVQARITLATALRAGGNVAGANEATRELLRETPSHRVAIAAAWTNAVLAGDAATRGLAIEQLAGSCSVPVRAIMFAVASEALAGASDPAGARRAAELGVQAEPSSARCVATLADSVLSAQDRTSASALERAISLVCARTRWCSALAEALDVLGEVSFAVGWTQRCVALRPGDREGIAALLRRLARARDGARLADALSWAMSQPQPAAPLAELVARALRDLIALDSDRAAVLARRALDAFGPRHGALREAMLEVADAARDGAFAAVVLERAVAVDFSADRPEILSSLVQRRQALGDADGEARAIACAMREGMTSPELAERLFALGGTKLGGDGELARLEAQAEWLSRADDKAAAAMAWRELGAALWDLSGDRIGAVAAWLRAAKLAPKRGYVTFGVDLARFAGARDALDCLAELVEKEPDRARSGSIAAEAARAALSLGEPGRAFELAALAVEKNPRLADALEIAELGAVGSARHASMSRLYETLGGKAMGRFGCRAAHYRGARFFEQHGDAGLALKHAALAFCAVPSEGATFLLLKRTAERADDRAEAVRTVVQVADAAKSKGLRAGWLLRAAAIASEGEDGRRLKVDVLLRAVLLAPDLGTLSLLADAARDLLRLAPEERDGLQVRLGRACKAVTAKADGPEGGRIALAFAQIGLDPFEDPEWALAAVTRAFACDADLDEYARLVPHAATLAGASDLTTHLAKIRELTEKPYANVGAPALRLLAALAVARGDTTLQASFLAKAAERDPDDDAVVREADAVLRSSADDALVARFEKVVPRSRRAEAFRALGTERARDGAFDEAIRAFERAAELSDEAERAELEAPLRAAYEAAGRAEEVEGRALREAAATQSTAVARAARWTEVAHHREARGDLVGAVDALLAAANLDAGPIERWSAIERVAELARLDDVRVSAIREIGARVSADAKVAVWKRLARAYEARLDMSAAEATWHSILELEPGEEEADYALESLISSRADYSDLANHLGRRAERLALQSGTREALRAVRLRRAAILEQRLERAEDACDELLLVLKESPDNTSAMSYLADLYDRMGDHARAAPLWIRVASLSRDPRAQCDLELRAARAALASGQETQALSLVRSVLSREPALREALELRIQISRSTGDDRELGEALADLAVASTDDDARLRAPWLVEAARAAARTGDVSLALGRAKHAAELLPDSVDAQLLARTLEYRARGSGPPDEARRTFEELARLSSEGLSQGDAALKAFLSAEALDAFQGRGAGARALAECEAQIGAHPLLALGKAERLVGQHKFQTAFPQFRLALQGDLSAVRERGRVAIAAAEAAIRANEIDAALELLEHAESEPATRSAAFMRRAQLFASRGDPAQARATLRELAESSAGDDRARALAQLARMQQASTEPVEQARALETFEGAVAAAKPEGALRVQLSTEREQMALRPAAGEAAEPTPAPAQVATAVELPPSGPVSDLRALQRAMGNAATPDERSQARLALARAQVDRGAHDAAATCLQEGLAEGRVEEGRMLAALLAELPERSSELVKVARAVADLVPGDAPSLAALRRAAILDQNVVHARAVEHVQRSFEADRGHMPPPLAAQREQPGMLSLLTRPSADAVGQALGLIWESAHEALAAKTAPAAADRAVPSIRTPSSYPLADAPRLLADGSSPLARVYEVAIRLLDLRVPVHVRRLTSGSRASLVPRRAPQPSEPLRASLELLYPVIVVVTGQDEETPALPYVLGQALGAALPQNALLLGLPRAEARRVWSAMLGAFGPPALGRSMDGVTARLAESFWQVIPPRVQRTLQELLLAADPDGLDAAIERARQCARRVGFFLSGDLRVAAEAVLADEGRGPAVVPSADLAALCASSPALADLVRLAISPEYADARWQPMPPASQRGNMSSGRFRIS